MAIITTNQPTAGLAGFSQNRRALTVDNRSSEYQYADGANQLQNSQSLFPDANIPLSKIDARFPVQYDAVATKNHVLGTTLIEYNGVVFYRIADVVTYAIDLGLTAFSLFLQPGTYQELSDIGNYRISLSIVGANKDDCIIDFGTSEGIIKIANDSYLQNFQATTARVTGTALIISGTTASLTNQDASGSVILNCDFRFTATGVSTNKEVGHLQGGNILIQFCSFVHPGQGSTVLTLLSLLPALEGFLSILNCTFTATNTATTQSHAVYIGTVEPTISNLNFSNNTLDIRGVNAAGVVAAPLSGVGLLNQDGINIFSNNEIRIGGSASGLGISIQFQFGQSAVSDDTLNYITGNRVVARSGSVLTIAIDCCDGINKIANNYILNATTGITVTNVNVSTIIQANTITATTTGAVLVAGGIYTVSDNHITHALAGYAVDFQGTNTQAVITNNFTRNSGAGSGVAYRGGTFTSCIFDGNRARTGTIAGLLIQATVAAGTNIITSNRNIGGGAGFLSFAVGTNVVANNLST